VRRFHQTLKKEKALIQLELADLVAKHGREILAIVLILIAGSMLLNSGISKREFSIDYPLVKASKTVELSDKRTETIHVSNPQDYGLIAAIPKSLAGNSEEMEVYFAGSKEVWADDPVIYFELGSVSAAIQIRYKARSDTASINSIFPKNFIYSLSAEQKNALAKELQGIAELNLEDAKANEAENALAAKFGKIFSNQGNFREGETEGGAAFFAAPAGQFSQVIAAIDSVRAKTESELAKTIQNKPETHPAQPIQQPAQNSIPEETAQAEKKRQELLAQHPWPEEIELGVTANNPNPAFEFDMVNPKNIPLANGKYINNFSFPDSGMILIDGLPQKEAPTKGIKIEMADNNGKEPYSMKITLNYSELTANNSTLPQKLQKEVKIDYKLFEGGHGPAIKLRINVNETGAILATDQLKDAAEHVKKIKGWEDIIIESQKDGKSRAASEIAQDAKKKLQELYSKQKFEYLMILGDDDQIPILTPEVLEGSAVLDQMFFADYTGDSVPDVAVGRVPMSDAKSIKDYFGIRKEFGPEPKIAMALIPDDLKTSIETVRKLIDGYKYRNEQPPKDLVKLSERLQNLIEATNSYSQEEEQPANYTTQNMQKAFAISPYGYQFANGGAGEPAVAGGKIPIYVNPTSEFLSGIAGNADEVEIFSHGQPEYFFNLNIEDYEKCSISLLPSQNSHPILLGDACHTASVQGKNAMKNGALAYVGCYKACYGIKVSVLNFGKDIGIGKSVKEIAEIYRDKIYQIYWKYTILYGDPSIVFPVKSPTVKAEGNTITFPKPGAELLLRSNALSDPKACIQNMQNNLNAKISAQATDKQGQKYVTGEIAAAGAGTLEFQKPVNPGQISKMSLNVIAAGGQISSYPMTLPRADAQQNIYIAAVPPKIFGLDYQGAVNFSFAIEDDGKSAKVLEPKFTPKGTIRGALDKGTFSLLESIYSQCFLTSDLTFAKSASNNLFIDSMAKQNPTRILGKYQPSLENIRKATVISGKRKSEAEIDRGNTLNDHTITIKISPTISKELYEGGALQNGFAIEFS